MNVFILGGGRPQTKKRKNEVEGSFFRYANSQSETVSQNNVFWSENRLGLEKKWVANPHQEFQGASLCFIHYYGRAKLFSH